MHCYSWIDWCVYVRAKVAVGDNATEVEACESKVKRGLARLLLVTKGHGHLFVDALGVGYACVIEGSI